MQLRRARTPSDLKWLLNERAALGGAIALLEADILKYREVLFAMEAELHQRQESLAALTHVISFGYPQVNPGAVREVHAWAGRYGKRGNLQAYLIEQLKAVFPRSLTSIELADLVCAQFAIVCRTTGQKSRQKDRVKRALNLLKNAGSVVALHDVRSTRVSRWTWTGERTTSVAEALALRQASYEYHNGPDHTSSHAV